MLERETDLKLAKEHAGLLERQEKKRQNDRLEILNKALD